MSMSNVSDELTVIRLVRGSKTTQWHVNKHHEFEIDFLFKGNHRSWLSAGVTWSRQQAPVTSQSGAFNITRAWLNYWCNVVTFFMLRLTVAFYLNKWQSWWCQITQWHTWIGSCSRCLTVCNNVDRSSGSNRISSCRWSCIDCRCNSVRDILMFITL